MDSLPYRLTNAQLRVWNEMEKDLASDRLMNRLIQGDVGSGKTILAFLAMIMASENGYQSALMAPTEVLARQHFEDMQKLLGNMGILQKRAKHVLLLGASRIAAYLSDDLLRSGNSVKIIEKDDARCDEISAALGGRAVVIHGDGAQHEVLDEEGHKPGKESWGYD